VIRAVLVLSLLVVPSFDAHAAAFTLSEADKSEALRVGASSITTDGFDTEWRVSNGGGESVTVLTPFHRLAIAARHAAFKDEPLKPAESDRVLRQDSNRLVLWVQLRGRDERFARFYVPRLMAGTRHIKPTFVQNERTAARQEDGAYVARCVYGFPARDLAETKKVALVVADGDGREVSRFDIDLSTMR
jgi:hypothetical protein